MFERGTSREVRRQVRREMLRRAGVEARDEGVRERRRSTSAAPSAPCRQASTAARSSSPVFDGWPARARSSASRRRFSSGREGSGGRPVDATTQRSYGTAGPSPQKLHRRGPTSPTGTAPRPSKNAPRRPGSVSPAAGDRVDRALHVDRGEVGVDRGAVGLFRRDAAGAHRRRAAAGCVYASGSGSSENQESAMKRPVPDGFMTSPPQSVSMPRSAVAVSAPSRSRQAGFSFFMRAEPEVETEQDEARRAHGLRDRIVVVERQLDQVLAVPAERGAAPRRRRRRARRRP